MLFKFEGVSHYLVGCCCVCWQIWPWKNSRSWDQPHNVSRSAENQASSQTLSGIFWFCCIFITSSVVDMSKVVLHVSESIEEVGSRGGKSPAESLLQRVIMPLFSFCPRVAVTGRIHIVCLYGCDRDESPHPHWRKTIQWENKHPCCEQGCLWFLLCFSWP